MNNSPFSIFTQYPNIIATLSTRKEGSMRLRGSASQMDLTYANRKRHFVTLGIKLSQIVAVRLAHGNNVISVTEKDKGNIIENADGLLTDNKDTFLAITVADCIPIYLYHDAKKIVGLVHAGWCGLAKNIIHNTITTISREYDINPSDLVVGIGPAISQKHYEVQNDVLSHFEKMVPSVSVCKNTKKYIDLKAIAKSQLVQSGIQCNNIEISEECTYTLEDKYFSYRRDKPDIPDTMVAVIGMTNNNLKN